MPEQWLLELIGYVASVLVAISLTMRSIVRLRVINLVGSVAFTVYGFLIAAYPVAAVNLFIACVNVYFLVGMARSSDFFDLIEIESGSSYVERFLAFYADEIRRFLPGFAPRAGEAPLAVFVLRNLVPAGLLLGYPREDGTLEVALDFVIPQFRDFKVGRYLFDERAAFFRQRGIVAVESPRGSDAHEAYLKRMGFEPAAEDRYRLALG
jgi:GNAT superfamily N-acetyltransferase